jgi:hypothetical protein
MWREGEAAHSIAVETEAVRVSKIITVKASVVPIHGETGLQSPPLSGEGKVMQCGSPLFLWQFSPFLPLEYQSQGQDMPHRLITG